jgi:arylsulfatase A-like enzyme
MNFYYMKKLLFFCFLFFAFSPLTTIYAQPPNRPNVIIIFIDDLGYGDLSCYGNRQVETTNIDALAKQGTRFTQFYVNSPVCSPSRVAMMTGHYPARHRFYTYLAGRKQNKENLMPDFLPADIPTLARIMHASGYATGHFGKWHLGGGRDVGDAPLPTAYGFDKTFTSFEGLGDRTLHLDDILNKQSLALGQGKIVEAPQHRQTEIYVDSALAFIKGVKGRPFFINFFPNDVHDPYNPAESTEKKYSTVTSNPEQQKFLAVLKEMDNQIGRFLAELKKMDLLKNTLILLASDNGPTDWPYYYKNGGEPPCSAGDLRGRKWSLYEGGIREPFIAVWPGKIPSGKVDKLSVLSVVDILPTVAALAHTNLPQDYVSDGFNESDILKGKKQQHPKELYWYYNNNPVPGKKENISPMLALRSGKWKFLMQPDGSEQQLYNLETDHKETRNLVSIEKAVSTSLASKLMNWYNEVVHAR